MQNRYQVVVSNIGIVYTGHSITEARKLFDLYSEACGGPDGESVVILLNCEAILEN